MDDLSQSGRARRATPADVAELVRLRAMMLKAMGEPRELLGASWREATETWLEQHLTLGVDLAVFVVDGSADHLVASAAGLCESRAPSGSNPSGRVGRIFSVATQPDHRRQGLARGCTAALVDWFTLHTVIGMLELSATENGDALYRSLGFRPLDSPVLRLQLSR